jgi:hypothetical protein
LIRLVTSFATSERHIEDFISLAKGSP